MPTKARLKFLIFVLGLAGVGGLGAVAFALLSQFVAYFNQGADPASIFRGHALVVPASDEARWLPFVNVERATTPSQVQREEILAAYWLAWEALGRAYETGNASDLATYWAGPAYEHARSSLDAAQEHQQTHGRHALRLRFFSDDGSVVAFDDPAFELTQTVNGISVTMTGSATVVMTLDQGFWRIRQLRLSLR